MDFIIQRNELEDFVMATQQRTFDEEIKLL